MNPAVVVLDQARLKRLGAAAVMVQHPATVLEVCGPKALECLQGLLTSDLVQPGDGSVVYAALLTPKGMIVADMWVLRLSPERLILVAEAAAGAAILGVFQRSIPARLARVDDRSNRLETLWLYGERALPSLAGAGLAVPDVENRLNLTGSGDEELVLARPHAAAPFQALVAGRPEPLARQAAALARAGVARGDRDDLEAARILAGWPGLGAEIQEKTLPQEVRYDEIQGVSYTKGCYLGQETVARLHFRGHTNRELRGLVWQGHPLLADMTLRGSDGKEMGTITSLLELPTVTVGLAVLRREVSPGDAVSSGVHQANVVALPFTPLALDT